MKIMVAEYAVATGDPEIIGEGCAMLGPHENYGCRVRGRNRRP